MVCLSVHRPLNDDDDCAGAGLLRVGVTTYYASLRYVAVGPGVFVGLPHLRRRPHAILGSTHDLGRGTGARRHRQPYYRTVLPFRFADLCASRSTTSFLLKLSSDSSSSFGFVRF